MLLSVVHNKTQLLLKSAISKRDSRDNLLDAMFWPKELRMEKRRTPWISSIKTLT